MRKGSHMTDEQRERVSAGLIAWAASPETQAEMSTVLEAWAAIPENQLKRFGPLVPDWKSGPQVNNARHHARRRILGFLPLNVWFAGSDGHHLDTDHVVFIPHALHQTVHHDHSTGRGMEQINALAYAYAGLTADVLDDTLPFD